MVWIFFISGLVFPWLSYFVDLWGNNFDAHFSDNTLEKLRVKDGSFLRRVIPFKEGDIVRNGYVYRHRYYLYPRVLALFIQSIIILIAVAIFLINTFVISFLSELVFLVVGGCLLGIWIIYTGIMNILSQGFHI